MFVPVDEFLDYKNGVICGPNDRSLVGFDTYFLKEWLMEDYDFTDEEADWFIDKVKELHKE